VIAGLGLLVLAAVGVASLLPSSLVGEKENKRTSEMEPTPYALTPASADPVNERIVFGLGHASVAEHAVLNFDIMGISRLAVEEIEHFRLASYTEKSQRYIRLDKDIVVPPEIKGAKQEREFRSLMNGLHEAYESAFQVIAGSGAEPVAANCRANR